MSKPAKQKNILTLDSTLSFGKYKLFTVRDVIYEDPQYLDWCIDEQLIELDNTAFVALQTKLKNL